MYFMIVLIVFFGQNMIVYREMLTGAPGRWL